MADFTSTFFLYKQLPDRKIKILRCKSLDTVVEIPEFIDGNPVTEIGAYAFSEHVRQPEDGTWTGTAEEMDGISEMMGVHLTGISLPASLMKVGAYAFYNCWNLEQLSCYSTTLDWGAGAFTGCIRVKDLDITVKEGEKSCFKEILAELRQTLYVTYHGRQEAQLVFPEFFEESVENTPAKVLETHIHGCGHQYRYAFVQSEFQFGIYDSLFSHVKAQEPEELVIRLAIGRLRYPCGLAEEARAVYDSYITAHRTAAAVLAVRMSDMELLRWLTERSSYSREELSDVIDAAGRKGDASVMSYLMNLTAGAGGETVSGEDRENPQSVARPRRKRFEL